MRLDAIEAHVYFKFLKCKVLIDKQFHLYLLSPNYFRQQSKSIERIKNNVKHALNFHCNLTFELNQSIGGGISCFFPQGLNCHACAAGLVAHSNLYDLLSGNFFFPQLISHRVIFIRTFFFVIQISLFFYNFFFICCCHYCD